MDQLQAGETLHDLGLPTVTVSFYFSQLHLLCLSDACMWASLVAQMIKNPPAMWETWVRSQGWEDSHGEGNGYPLQYCGLENSMDCIVHGVAKSLTLLNDLHSHSLSMYPY